MSKKKHKGGKLPPGKFVALPITVLKTAMAALSPTELRVWLALCAQCQPWANGTGKLCASVLKECHLGSWTTVGSAVEKLIAEHLIVRTRASRPRHCALYGVTHLSLNREAMAKEKAAEPTELATEGVARQRTQLATDSCSESLTTHGVASRYRNCSESR